MCLHKFLGECPNCVPDLDKEHHPNNYDCPKFKEISMRTLEVKPKPLKNKGFEKPLKNEGFELNP